MARARVVKHPTREDLVAFLEYHHNGMMLARMHKEYGLHTVEQHQAFWRIEAWLKDLASGVWPPTSGGDQGGLVAGST